MKDIVECCPECETEIAFQNYDQVKQCDNCQTKWKLGSYWESGEGTLVDILMEVKMDGTIVDMTGLTVVGDEPVISKEEVEKKKENKYVREIAPNVFVDVYDVLTCFEVTCPARAHAIKKLLCTGLRGHKDVVTDIEESIQALQRAVELLEV